MPLGAEQRNGLIRRTEQHWACKDPDRFERYIDRLLPLELAAARGRGADNLPVPEDGPLDLLVLLLGYSFEPLLQSIVAYRPRNLLVAYNSHYGSGENGDGRVHHDRFLDLVRRACGNGDLLGQFADLQTPRNLSDSGSRAQHACDDPVSVFSFLRNRVIPGLNAGTWLPSKVLVDITGAKKSMVSGAYLFAAFAGVGVTYVDFDEYDQEHQRPYGFTCRIGRLRSPARAFGLDDWTRVRHLYETSSFGAMQDALGEIADAMDEQEGAALFTDIERRAVCCLWRAAGFYQRWAEGDYRNSRELWQSLPASGFCAAIAPPPAVTPLSGCWPEAQGADDFVRKIGFLETGGEPPDLRRSLFGNPDLIALYADDEIEKIRRLIDHAEDCRSALLRAAGLNELLLRFRLIRLWLLKQVSCQWEFEKETAVLHAEEACHETLQRRLSESPGASALVNFLTSKCSAIKLKPNASKRDCLSVVSVRRLEGSMEMKAYWKHLDSSGVDTLSPHQLASIRNKAIHFTVPVSNDLADRVITHVRAARKELENGGWLGDSLLVNDTPPEFTPTWDALCCACGIAFLPPTRPKEVNHD